MAMCDATKKSDAKYGFAQQIGRFGIHFKLQAGGSGTQSRNQASGSGTQFTNQACTSGTQFINQAGGSGTQSINQAGGSGMQQQTSTISRSTVGLKVAPNVAGPSRCNVPAAPGSNYKSKSICDSKQATPSIVNNSANTKLIPSIGSKQSGNAAVSAQASAVSAQASAVSAQALAVSAQASAVSTQASAVSAQASAVSTQASAVSAQASAVSAQASAASVQSVAKSLISVQNSQAVGASFHPSTNVVSNGATTGTSSSRKNPVIVRQTNTSRKRIANARIQNLSVQKHPKLVGGSTSCKTSNSGATFCLSRVSNGATCNNSNDSACKLLSNGASSNNFDDCAVSRICSPVTCQNLITDQVPDKSPSGECQSCAALKDANDLLQMNTKALESEIDNLSRTAIEFPEQWSRFDPASKYKRVVLQTSSCEYQEVLNNIREESVNNNIHIHSIERIENWQLYSIYQVKKFWMIETDVKDDEVEKILWHGTDSNDVSNICIYGFNRSYAGKNATLYGKGVYFSADFQFSAFSRYAVPDDNNRRHVFRCRVLTGRYTLGSADYKEPPVIDPATGERFDSVADYVKHPTIFVIFQDCAAYPDYLVTFS